MLLMKYKSLQFVQITSDKNIESCAENVFLPLKSDRISTGEIPCMSLINKVMRFVLMLFVALPLTLKAQLELEGTVQTRVNDPAVTVTVDRSSIKAG